MDEFCHNCRLWKANKERDKEAPRRSQCLLNPPQAGGLMMQQGISGAQPIVIWGTPEPSMNDWCSHWQPAAQLIQG